MHRIESVLNGLTYSEREIYSTSVHCAVLACRIMPGRTMQLSRLFNRKENGNFNCSDDRQGHLKSGLLPQTVLPCSDGNWLQSCASQTCAPKTRSGLAVVSTVWFYQTSPRQLFICIHHHLLLCLLLSQLPVGFLDQFYLQLWVLFHKGSLRGNRAFCQGNNPQSSP